MSYPELVSEVHQGTPIAFGEGNVGRVRLNRRGEIVTTDFTMQAAMEGRLFTASAGSLTTPHNVDFRRRD